MLDPDRLMSLDEHGDRVKIIPAEVHGFWRRHRDWSQWVLILFFLALPWTQVNGLQTILLDIANRKFVILGMIFWSHDAPLIFFFLLAATIGLAFITSIWGRVWCGWACPQTVFIDGVFRKIEFWIEGNHLQRRALLSAPLNLNYIFKKTSKWVAFLLVSSLISHSFVAYFVGSKELLAMIQGNPTENWTYFLLISIMTLLILFDFGWFREQFCIIMCPYGRIQSLLMDQNSLAVIYDEGRGEPRKGKTVASQKSGDCVACNRCVQVCPTACDIRKGVQLECIACTACIDACDEIMTKVNKPKGLIRYDSVSGQKNSLKSMRSLMYLGILFIAAVALIYNVSSRKDAQVLVIRSKDSPYSLIKDEQGDEKILNHFKMHIENQSHHDIKVELEVSKPSQEAGFKIVVPSNNFEIQAGKESTLHFFTESPKSVTSGIGQANLELQVMTTQKEIDKKEVQNHPLTVLGPR